MRHFGALLGHLGSPLAPLDHLGNVSHMVADVAHTPSVFLFFVGGFLLSYVPARIFDYLQYVGYAVITYIAYRIATTSLETNKKGSSVDKPFTFVQACLFHWINPKGVVMAVS